MESQHRTIHHTGFGTEETEETTPLAFGVCAGHGLRHLLRFFTGNYGQHFFDNRVSLNGLKIIGHRLFLHIKYRLRLYYNYIGRIVQLFALWLNKVGQCPVYSPGMPPGDIITLLLHLNCNRLNVSSLDRHRRLRYLHLQRLVDTNPIPYWNHNKKRNHCGNCHTHNPETNSMTL